MFLDEPAEVGDRLLVPAGGDQCPQAQLSSVDVQIIEPHGLEPRPLLVGVLGVCGAAPQGESGVDLGQRERRFAVGQVTARGAESAFEVVGVESRGAELETVTGPAGDDADAGAVVDEQAPQPGHVAAQRRGGGVGRLAGEDDVGEPVDGHDPAGVDQQRGEQPTDLRSADTDDAVSLQLQRPEHREPHEAS